MGILSDTLEDNKERVGQLLSVDWQPQYDFEHEVQPAKTVACPLCASWFPGEDELQRHILGAHGRLQVYIRLDGRVIQDLHYTEGPIRELLVVVLGDQPASVCICLSEKEVYRVSVQPGRPVQLAKVIPAKYVGVVSLSIHLAQVRRQYQIYLSTQPHIDVGILDAAIHDLELGLVTNSEPNWAVFRHSWLHGPHRHPMEKRYLEGFFEYILGSHMELRQNPQAGTHFERAFGLIRPFATDMAHTARCLLGIKMNWFHLLAACGSRSRFYPANLFFNSSFKNAVRSGLKPAFDFADSAGVWVDPFSELLLEGIGCFFLRDYVRIEPVFDRLEKHPLIADRNNFDKLRFLKARTLRAKQELVLAERQYAYLRHHPIFKTEAEEFCDKKRKN